MKKHLLPLWVITACILPSAWGATVFTDDFETGTMAKWTTTGTNPLDPSTTQNAVPPGGRFSALMNTSIDRMHRNLIADNVGKELDGEVWVSFWIYDTGAAGSTGSSRVFNEIRGYSGGTGLPNGGTVASGSIAQLLAAGKFTSVTLPGETFTATKYQGRVAFHTPQPTGDTGWFNLNGPGSPNRSVGWHRFDIRRLCDGTTVEFYVDGILSRTFTGGTAQSFDTLILGPGLGSQIGDAWLDGMEVRTGCCNETTPPQITCPQQIQACACDPAGAPVTFTVTATDNHDPNPTVNCDPPSGSVFPPGSHVVTCVARDECGNVSRCEFTVTVREDKEPPTLECPRDIRAWTCSQEGLAVDYVVSAADDCDSSPTVICNPPSGTLFPVGTTPVVCTAKDDCGRESRCEFKVEVTQDTEPPRMVCPTDIRIEECREQVVQYTVTATDNADPSPSVVCTPPSGSPFPVGSTPVTCTATDRCGHKAECTFKVEIVCPCVRPPGGMVNWWLFDEPPGTTIANDIVSFNNIGVHMNAPTVTAGKVRNALCFNGDNQWVEVRDHPEVNFMGACIPGAPLAESFTIDAWIRADTTQGLLTILDKRINPSDPIGYSLFIANGRLAFQMADGSGGGGSCGPTASCENYGETTPSITAGNWHFVAVAVQRCDASGSPGVGTLYVDGNPVLTFTPRKGDMYNPSNLLIGVRNPAFGSANFRGCIDELEYFKRALSHSELQAIYNAGSHGKCKPCLRCPEDITVETCNPDGTQVCYNPPAPCEGTTVQCQPPPCSFFPANTSTLVTCEAINSAGVPVDRCTFAVIVIGDTRPPSIACPPDIVVSNDPNACGAKVDYPPPQAGDNCPGVSVTCAPASGSFFLVGTTTVTCTATDASGNSDTCRFQITVRDVEPPHIVCPNDIRRESCQETVIDYSVSATDNCPGVTVVCTPPSGSPFPVGSTPVTCTATDASGNTASCSFKVEIICPCVPPPAGMVDWWTFDEPAGPVANDIASFNNQGVHMNGPTVIPGKVRNALCFNGDNQWVEVRDHPEINFLGDCANDVGESFTIDAWIRLSPNGVQGVRTFLDKRDNPASPQGYSFYVVNGRLGFQMGNGVGNNICNTPGSACNNYVEPNASITPGVWHFVAVTVQRCRGMGTLYVDGNPVLVFTPLSGDLNNAANMFIGVRNPAFGGANFPGCIDELEYFKRALSQAELQAIYNAGSAGKCKPCIRCPDDITVRICNPNGTDVCYDVPVLCDGLTVKCEPPPCSFFPANTSTLVKCEATDATGVVVERCEFSVTVIGDTQPPTIVCPPDIAVPNDPNACGAKVDYPAPQAGDNCPGVSVTCAPPSGGFFPVGTTSVTCTATDASGNTASCTFQITVRDTEPPRIVCPNDIRRESCQETIVDYSVSATDNCPGVTVVCTPPSGSPFPVGSTPVTCTATDASGNQASCTFKVEITCPCVPPPPGMVDWWPFDETTGPVANDIASFNNQGVHMNGPTVISGKVRNALCFNGDNQWVEVRDHPEINFHGVCGGPAFAESFTIDAWVRVNANSAGGLMTILDKRSNPTNPQGYSLFIFNGRLAFQMADGSGGGPVCGPGASCENYGEPTPSIIPGAWHLVAVTVQRCGAAGGPGVGQLYVDGNLVHTFTPRTGDLNNPANLFIGARNPIFGAANFPGCIDELEYFKRALTQAELQAIYNAGSGGKCKPCIRCPDDMTVVSCSPNGTDVCYDVPVLCEGLTVRCTPPPCSFFPMGTTQVNCEATDATGVVVERCSFRVTVIRDTTPPTITCPGDMVVPNNPGECGAKVDYPPPQASDNCPGVRVECTPASGDFFPVGTTAVTCTATDASGNTASCTFKITVRDAEPPRIACPDDITVRTCDRRVRVRYAPTATDNCPGVTVVCVPPSGTAFPGGTHPVTCTATDASGNTASCSFKVTVIVLPPPRLVITHIGQGQVRICWESECPDWRLQCARRLNPPIMWQFVSAPVTTVGNRHCVTLPARDAHQFYRLCRREVNEVEAQDNLLPPLGTYRSPGDLVTPFFIGGDPDRPLLMRRFAHPIPATTPRRPPPCPSCAPDIHHIETHLRFQVSNDGGQTWMDATATSEATVAVQATPAPDDSYDVEILSLLARGVAGSMPPFMIRESPTRASTGRMLINPDDDGDGYQIGSFFDVFTEISLDDGASWHPAEAPIPMDLAVPKK
jgi:hypothetical protein